MPNSISTTLETLARSSVPLLESAVAPLAKHFTLLAGAKESPLSTIQVPNPAVLPPAEIDTVNWEAAAESTIAALTATPHVVTQRMNLSNLDVQNGSIVEHLLESASRQFAARIWEQVVAVLTVGNYGTSLVAGAAEAFGWSDVPALVAAVRNPTRTLVLDSAYIARLCDRPPGPLTVPGFVITSEADFSMASGGVIGFVSSPESLVVVAGPPAVARSGAYVFETRNVLLPGLGITIALSVWMNAGLRGSWASYDAIIAVTPAKTAAGRIITSA